MEASAHSSSRAIPDMTAGAHSSTVNTGFTRAHTFIIAEMRNYLEADGRGLPKTLAKLSAKVKSAKGKKKLVWEDWQQSWRISLEEDLTQKVARKRERYKRVKDNNRATGRNTLRFQFFTEMDGLLAGHHDVSYPVIGTAKGVEIRRPEALELSPSPAPSWSDPSPGPSLLGRVRRKQPEVIEFLRQSEAASQARHEELMAQLKSSEETFDRHMTAFLQKF